MNFFDWLWLIPVLPLLGAAINGIFGKRLPPEGVAGIAAGSVAGSFLISAAVFLQMWRLPATDLPIVTNYFTWIQAGHFTSNFGFLLDPLSGVMILVVTGVGLLIHVYSIGYMSGEPGFYRYFAYLNLFTFSMLTLVLANNYLLMFVGWEGVGLCSYLLIGFWFFRKSAADAGKKAFIVNRVGDFGFIIAVLLMFWTFESLDFQTVFARVENLPVFPAEPLGEVGAITTIGLLLFVGAAGKSAQVPLYVWLPDAMEGPTPVSALIHAATMVTAGVYMVARSAVLYDNAPGALLVIAAVGAFTAIFAASIGLVQTDIKRILAYSTVSQLGFMFLACGVAAYAAGVFHLMTHAFFKALLFLGAGSVIHGMSGIQDVRRMGGLRHEMPWTFRTFVIGALAISGIPLFSGFFSKDAILWAAWSSPQFGKLFWAVGLTAAGFTAFYTFRLVILAFFGTPRYTPQEVHRPHESPPSMLVPLVILGVFAIIAGYAGIPPLLGGHEAFQTFLGQPPHEEHQPLVEALVMAASVVVALAGVGLAYLFYVARPDVPAKLASRANAMYTILVNKYYVDQLYDAIIVWPVVRASRDFLWKFIDASVIDGSVNNLGRAVRGIGGGLKYMQSGYVRTYAGWIFLGGVIIVVWFLR